MKGKLFTLAMAIALVAALALTGCGDTTTTDDADATPSPSASVSDDASSTDAEDVGDGVTVFAFSVTFADGSVKNWNVHTDSDMVGDALVEVGLIEGDETDNGLFVKTVDGEEAEYTDDTPVFWQFRINGEVADSGADSTEITEGSAYAFVYTTYSET